MREEPEDGRDVQSVERAEGADGVEEQCGGHEDFLHVEAFEVGPCGGYNGGDGRTGGWASDGHGVGPPYAFEVEGAQPWKSGYAERQTLCSDEKLGLVGGIMARSGARQA